MGTPKTKARRLLAALALFAVVVVAALRQLN